MNASASERGSAAIERPISGPTLTRLRILLDRSSVANSTTAGLSGSDASYVIDGSSKYPRPIRLRLPVAGQASLDGLLALRVRGGDGQLVPLSELVTVQCTHWDGAILHKDLLPVVYVMGDESGRVDSPLYGMFDLVGQVADNTIDGQHLSQHYIAQPADTSGSLVICTTASQSRADCTRAIRPANRVTRRSWRRAVAKIASG